MRPTTSWVSGSPSRSTTEQLRVGRLHHPSPQTRASPASAQSPGVTFPAPLLVGRKVGAALLADTDIRTKIGCRLGGCGTSIKGPAPDPRDHYLHARAHEVRATLAQPLTWRANLEQERLRRAVELRNLIHEHYLPDGQHPLKTRTSKWTGCPHRWTSADRVVRVIPQDIAHPWLGFACTTSLARTRADRREMSASSLEDSITTRLEELVPGVTVSGVVSTGPVEVGDVKWQGGNILVLTYKEGHGCTGHAVLGRDNEARLSIGVPGQTRAFDGDASEWRLAAEALGSKYAARRTADHQRVAGLG